MKRYFHTTGSCDSYEHYMVNLESRLAQIKKMIEKLYPLSLNFNKRKQPGMHIIELNGMAIIEAVI